MHVPPNSLFMDKMNQTLRDERAQRGSNNNSSGIGNILHNTGNGALGTIRIELARDGIHQHEPAHGVPRMSGMNNNASNTQHYDHGPSRSCVASAEEDDARFPLVEEFLRALDEKARFTPDFYDFSRYSQQLVQEHEFRRIHDLYDAARDTKGRFFTDQAGLQMAMSNGTASKLFKSIELKVREIRRSA